MMLKMSASTFTAAPPRASKRSGIREGPRSAAGLAARLLEQRERPGRGGVARLADRLERLGGAHARLPGPQVGVVVVAGDRTELEVHEGVVGAAELGTPADVSAF